MPLTAAARAATVDLVLGVQVAQAQSEVSGSGILQTIVTEGNKTSYPETSRTALVAADAPTGGDLTTTGFAGAAGVNLFDCGNALTLAIRATCTVAGATLTGFVVLYDVSANPLGKSEAVTFTADGTLRLGNAAGDFVSTRALVDCGAARKARFFVSSVTAGSWSVYARPV